MTVAVVTACFGAATPAAHAAASCPEPGPNGWQKASPAAAGMDAAKLADAMNDGPAALSLSVRVFRNGCLVAGDPLQDANRDTRFESWSMAKSITSLMFGRAVELGLISPDDPVGSLLPEADREHGAITMRQLLTMTSGLHWNGLRDYNVFTGFDRVRDALTLGTDHKPGTYFEYAQSPVSLLAEAIGRAAGQDAGAFAQRELMTPLGIQADSWNWTRDKSGQIGGFYGVQMRTEDYARLGELMRRGGAWKGKRLLSKTYMRDAITPTKTNGCYGWLIWLNRDKPCVGPTITDRPVENTREFPDLPTDLYRFSGLFGQLVTMFPSQGIVVARNGQDAGLLPTGGSSWEHTLYRKVLASVTDQRIPTPAPEANAGPRDQPNPDYGFQTALADPGQYSKGVAQDPLPAAGPARARAMRLGPLNVRATPKGFLRVRVGCPPRWPARVTALCSGVLRMEGTRKGVRYSVKPGRQQIVRFQLTRKRLGRLKKATRVALNYSGRNPDSTGGTYTKASSTVLAAKRRR